MSSLSRTTGRKTIAVLADFFNSIGGGYEAQLREHLSARAFELDLNLLFFYGHALGGPDPWAAAHNTIFDLVHPDRVDGVLLLSTCLASHCGLEEFSRFAERYRERPACSIGIALPGIASVIVDNQPGMEAAVEHLIREHACSRIAFIGGTKRNPEAVVRFEAYRRVLARHGIEHDPRLFATGEFSTSVGRAAMNQILARGAPFDAVVAANDCMALGAIDALRASGRRVPAQIPVTGFDDILQARLSKPALTTVAQPFDAIANMAMGMLMDQFHGRTVATSNAIPTTFLPRQSCGCGLMTIRTTIQKQAASPADALGWVQTRVAMLRELLSQPFKIGSSDGASEARLLVHGLQTELSGQRDAFLRVVEQMLEHMEDDSERHRALAECVNRLRENLATVSTPKLTELWYRALHLVEISSTAMQMHHRMDLDESYAKLLVASESVSLAFDLTTLEQSLVKGLPETGIKNACLSRFQGKSSTRLIPLVCLLDGEPWQAKEQDFPAELLAPPGAFPLERSHASLVFPLTFEAETLGIAVFEYSPEANGYHVLRSQISAALRGVVLHQQLVQESMLRERSIQERTSTTKRMEALRVLAGGVAHDLNNALGPLVALPDVILHELDQPGAGEEVLATIKTDVQSIRAAALRAAQTIKDLLTLSRQGRTTKLPIDLNATVAGCLGHGPGRHALPANQQIHLTIDLVPDALIIHASEVQLGRAIANLVGNAMEAIAGPGEIRVQTALRYVDKPLAGYETVPSGDYAVLTVADNGSGILAHELHRVFEPFFSKKLTRENTGTGLGLAIVHGVVKEHEGFIDVASTPDVGTTFSLFFPRFRGAVEQRTESKSAPTGNARILVVDDERLVLRTCRRVLVHLGYHVDALESGQKACEIFATAAQTGSSPYDLVILDVILNEPLDGLEIYEKIQELFPGQRAILTSGHAPNERSRRTVQKGLPWLVKPYSRETLAQAVQAALKGVSSASRSS